MGEEPVPKVAPCCNQQLIRVSLPDDNHIAYVLF
ncbi:hypothetical protein FHW02_000233 [Ochrobactrum sp. RH1CCR137]|nr:hypothetical protein [Ochrobactrum sp. RH1CCR137]MBA8854110.1 hypothetical protein [Ochrobactrum sp. RH1CCR134]